jgi:hypothetical protein
VQDIAALLWPCVAVYAVWRGAQVAERFAPVRAEVLPPDPMDEDVPQDLLALVGTETEAWAQEQLLRVIRERYADLRDWNLVRSAMGIGVISA